MAAAGAWGVRGPADVCLCCRGVCGGRALGAADAGAGGSKACGVRPDKHFLLGWLQPHRLCRKHLGVSSLLDFWQATRKIGRFCK